jgi:hypothetical protein
LEEMMADFPKYSVELLQLLAREIPKPAWPTTAAGAAMLDDRLIRQNIWFASQRALVDDLLAQVEELEREDEPETQEDDNTYWTADGGPRVIPAALDIRTASVGASGELVADADGKVPDSVDP